MTKAAIYARVSTEEQRERQTIQNQVSEAQRYCQEHGLTVHDVYLDDGVSGTVPFGLRKEGARLLADAGQGCFSVVVVLKVDRLGRDTRIVLNTVEDLATAGVQIKGIQDDIDPQTAQGKFFLTVQAGMATYERDTIIQRSILGTNRLAKEGAWLGGIVPFGYRVDGQHQHARLVPSEEPLGETAMSESDVVRLIYDMLVQDGCSTYQIAHHLNARGIPPAYVRDSRKLARGKRTEATAGIWRPSRIQNMITNTTYKGIHQYGRRSTRKREVIERAVPALVDESTWEAAQTQLRANRTLSKKNAKRRYLLRGLIKCGTCGLTYCGTTQATKPGEPVYYMCNGKKMARGLYGEKGLRCPSPSLRGEIEDTIWADIEAFLRNPGDVLDQLAGKNVVVEHDKTGVDRERREIAQVRLKKRQERDAILTLYRQGRITDTDLDGQLGAMTVEEAALDQRQAALDARIETAAQVEETMASTRDLLTEIGTILDESITWETKRKIVETLVESVRVEPVADGAGAVPELTVTYRFSSVVDHTDTGS